MDALTRTREALNIVVDGNKMTCDEATGEVTIAIASEGGRVRRIGRITNHPSVGVLYTKRVREADRYKELEGWGINYALLQILNEVKGHLLLVAPDADYTISAWGALALGTVRNYGKRRKGCELQVFVPNKNFVKTQRFGRAW